MDEIGRYLNKSGETLATKGVGEVHSLTCAEKAENISIIAYHNAEGTFLPPDLIFKRMRTVYLQLSRTTYLLRPQTNQNVAGYALLHLSKSMQTTGLPKAAYTFATASITSIFVFSL